MSIETIRAKSLNHPIFIAELKEAGLGDLSLSVADNGEIEARGLTPEQRALLLATIDAHDATAAAFQEAKKGKLREITARRDSAMKALTVEFGDATYDADEASVQRMTSASMMLERFKDDPRAPATVSWLDHDNVTRDLTPADLSELAALAWLATQAVWSRNHAAKVAIEAARTVAEIEAVTW